jgi:hypothetical protein
MMEDGMERDGLPIPQRVARLEALREADRERVAELSATMHSMDGKLDLLLTKDSRNAGGKAALGVFLNGAGQAIWAAVIAGAVVAAEFVLRVPKQ